VREIVAVGGVPGYPGPSRSARGGGCDHCGSGVHALAAWSDHFEGAARLPL